MTVVNNEEMKQLQDALDEFLKNAPPGFSELSDEQKVVTIGRSIAKLPPEVIAIACLVIMDKAIFGGKAKDDRERLLIAYSALAVVKNVLGEFAEEEKAARKAKKSAPQAARALEFADSAIKRAIRTAKEEVAKKQAAGEQVIQLPDKMIMPGNDSIN